jgi:tyrosine-protein kinase Etk/Wzc
MHKEKSEKSIMETELPAQFSSFGGFEGTSLLPWLLLLAQNKRIILAWTLASAGVALLVSLLIPNKYTATTLILPPQQTQSSATAMLGQLGALANLGGKDLGLKNPGDLYVGILKSRTIADDLINQFDLKHLYRDDRMADARADLSKHSTIETGKDSLISISFEDWDPKRAAQIANAYVDDLYKANQRLAVTEAAQRRLFYEKQLEAEKEALANAEVDLKKTQEATGLIQPNSQADAIIRSVASLRAQITAKEVQIQGMRSFSTEENPDLLRPLRELAALRAEMARLENSQNVGGGNIQVPTGRVPQVGLEYTRKLREVKYHEQLFEILAKQYEAARIDEGRNASIIQVVDSAVEPDRKSSPKRVVIVALTMTTAFFAVLSYVLIMETFVRAQENPLRATQITALKRLLIGQAGIGLRVRKNR